MKTILILISILILVGCCPNNVIKQNDMVTRDTTYVPRYIHDSIRVEAEPKIVYTDTGHVIIQPYLATIDSLYNVNNNLIRVRMRYSVPSNKAEIKIDEVKADSAMVINKTENQTITKSVEVPKPKDFWDYLLLFGMVAIGGLMGYIIAKVTK
jgi:hypothetical protein